MAGLGFLNKDPEKSHHEHLDVSILGDDLEAVEVCPHLRDVVDDRGNAEDSRVTAIVLEMPEEEGEDQADAHPHDPGSESEGEQSEVGQRLHHSSELRHGPQLTGEHLHPLRLLLQSLFLVLLGLE